MYILNIDKSKSHTTPQIVGRVADLPYSPLEVQVFDGMEVLDLTGYTIEFRGVTSTDNKVMISSGFKTTNAKNGEFEFTFPKNFYSAPGKFKRAYFVVKKNGKTDSTQDMLIHVLDSVDIDLQDAEDILEGLDKIIKEVEAQAKEDVDRIIKQIEKDTASTIADSNKKLAELDKQMNDFKNNTNNTITQINSNISKINSDIGTSNNKLENLQSKLDDLSNKINDKNLLTKGDLDHTVVGFYNYFSKDKSTIGYLGGNGSSIVNNSSQGEMTSDYIYIGDVDSVQFAYFMNPTPTDKWWAFSWYDSDKNTLGIRPSWNLTGTSGSTDVVRRTEYVPNNAVYVRVSARHLKDNSCLFHVLKSDVEHDWIPNVGDVPLKEDLNKYKYEVDNRSISSSNLLRNTIDFKPLPPTHEIGSGYQLRLVNNRLRFQVDEYIEGNAIKLKLSEDIRSGDYVTISFKAFIWTMSTKYRFKMSYGSYSDWFMFPTSNEVWWVSHTFKVGDIKPNTWFWVETTHTFEVEPQSLIITRSSNPSDWSPDPRDLIDMKNELENLKKTVTALGGS